MKPCWLVRWWCRSGACPPTGMDPWVETHRWFFFDCNTAYRIADALNARGHANISYNVYPA
jgi:hypothetical protein